MIHLIVCTGENGEIGKNNDMPWGRGLPADLRYFKKVTMGFDVVMGRKTFESILDSLGKPLPGRRNIVLTRDKGYTYEGITVYHDINDVVENEFVREGNDVFIIGGASIYKEFLPIADSIYLTKIHQTFNADTFFPKFSLKKWELVSKEERKKDEENPYDYEFLVYKRKRD